MDKIPTAEEYFKPFRDEDGQYGCRLIEAHLREFAKLHVKAALEAASKNKFISSVNNSLVEHTFNAKNSILNSYPENLIK